jgi:hypothetical protein
MDRHEPAPAAPPVPVGGSFGPLWLILLAGLLVWQCWMTLTLFAPPTGSPRTYLKTAWQNLTDDQPLLAGRHPLHLYFGYLGARSLLEHGTPCCYDPAFQAGYPKTPVFDSGSRPAELFLLAGGGKYRPAAYKIGVAACCCLAPLLLALSAWGLGLGRAGTTLTVGLGLLVWWGGPGQAALVDGDLDVLLSALCGLASICMLLRFNQFPGVFSWLALFLTSCAGWYAHPVLLMMLLPVALIFYLSVGTKHHIGWHLALLASLAATIGANSFWLVDWARSWWIRLPVQLGAAPLRHRTIQTVWDAPLWGEPADKALGVLLFILGAMGVLLLNQTRRRAAARLLGFGAGGFLALAIGGMLSAPLGQLGAGELLLPALWFAVPAAAFVLVQLAEWLPVWSGGAGRGFAIGAVLIAVAGFLGWPFLIAWAPRCARAAPLEIGLGRDRAALVNAIREHTDPNARILWQDGPGATSASRWSVLLPLLTGRSFVGGLDPSASIEHAYAGFTEQTLAGRPFADWSDVELDDFCRRYNVGSIICVTPAARERIHAWKMARQTGTVAGEVPRQLFSVGTHSYVLRGQARWLGADRQRIALADVVPENGEVVLSLHYQAGMQAMPSRVQIEREPDPFDPIPFIRLRIPGPVPRVTLIWGGK